MTAHEVADRLVEGWLGDPPPKVVDAAVMLRQQADLLKAREDALVQMQDWYKARGKTLHAHVVSKVALKLRRVGK